MNWFDDMMITFQLLIVVERRIPPASELKPYLWDYDFTAGWDRTVDTRNYVLDGGPDPPWKGALLRGRGGLLESIGTLCGHLCKNGWTDNDAVWVMGSDWSKESKIRWGPDPRWEGVILEERGAHCKTG